MKEYWVNVYYNNRIGSSYRNKKDAILISSLVLMKYECKPLYRIHVKLK